MFSTVGIAVACVALVLMFGAAGFMSLKLAGQNWRASTGRTYLAVRANCMSGIALLIWMVGWPVCLIGAKTFMGGTGAALCAALIFCPAAAVMVRGTTYNLSILAGDSALPSWLKKLLVGLLVVMAAGVGASITTIIRHFGDIMGWPLAGTVISVAGGSLLAWQIFRHFRKKEWLEHYLQDIEGV